jgi:hypothetical protein
MPGGERIKPMIISRLLALRSFRQLTLVGKSFLLGNTDLQLKARADRSPLLAARVFEMVTTEIAMQFTKLAVAAILAGLMSGPAMAQAQTAQQPAAGPAAQAQAKLSSDSLVGDILDYPAAKAVLVKHIPAIGQDDQIEQARSMTLRSLQQFAPEAFTDAVLAAIDADLAKLPPPGAPKQ